MAPGFPRVGRAAPLSYLCVYNVVYLRLCCSQERRSASRQQSSAARKNSDEFPARGWCVDAAASPPSEWRAARAAAYPFARAASCVKPRYLWHAEFQVVTPLSPGSVGAVTGCEGVGANPSPNAPSA